ncbi:MAG: capsular polysaccharide synthesis protein [Simkaniaceae bacterium]|nr:capsular polysaccharide synthesis protein [Candidatus Sacchlamyda saccharinae]
MKNKRLITIFSLLSLVVTLLTQTSKTIRSPSFEESQVLDSYTPQDLINLQLSFGKKRWKRVCRTYTRHLAGKRKRLRREKIPKIIHQIWLGDKIPEDIQKCQATWKELHPDWDYHLWTKEEVSFLYLQNQRTYDSAQSTKEKSTLLRYEILHQFGGVFVENTTCCFKSIDILNEHCHFYASLTDQIKTPKLSDQIIAATPRHPIIQNCLQTHRDRPCNLTESYFRTCKKHPAQANIALPVGYWDTTAL